MFDAISGALGAAGGLISGIGSLVHGGQQLKLQREQFEYQKQLNQQMMQREDTAVQRRSKDLEAAGLSKTLAAGAPSEAKGGVSAPPSAAGNEMMATGYSQIGNSIGTALRDMQSYADYLNTIKQAEKTQADIQNTQADTQIKLWNSGLAKRFELPVGEKPDWQSASIRGLKTMADSDNALSKAAKIGLNVLPWLIPGGMMVGHLGKAIKGFKSGKKVVNVFKAAGHIFKR